LAGYPDRNRIASSVPTFGFSGSKGRMAGTLSSTLAKLA
jgi:hypothetical protein